MKCCRLNAITFKLETNETFYNIYCLYIFPFLILNLIVYLTSLVPT